jgi:hypothetical protein
MLSEQPPNEAADTPPTPLTITEKAFANRFQLVDRRLQFLQEIISQQAFEVQFERNERQGEIDAISKHFLSQLAEIRSAQITDNYQILANQSGIVRLEQRLEDFEQTFEPAPSAAVQWVRAIAFALIGAALMMGAITANDYVNLSLTAHPVPSVTSK